MIDQVAGITTLLENVLNRPLLKYHCIIQQVTVWKNIKFSACYATSS